MNGDGGGVSDGDDDGRSCETIMARKVSGDDYAVGGRETTYDECLRGKIYISCLRESYTHSFLRKFYDERQRTKFARA